MKILADACLPGLEAAFPKPFELCVFQNPQEIPLLLQGQEVLLCRSTLRVDEALLKGQDSLQYVATASSGRDHIDADYLQRAGIKLIDAKGANAKAVADYVLASIAYLQKYKHFSGLKAGVIGVGEVGSRVVKRLQALGMEVLCNDPLRAEYDLNFQNHSLEDLALCDLITIHASLHDSFPFPSRNLIHDSFLRELKTDAVLINASRGGIVNEDELLNMKNSFIYCTDVYSNEPEINKKIVEFATVCTPHIAGHSVEAKTNALRIISEKLRGNVQPTRLHIHEKIPVKKQQGKKADWQDLILSLYNPIEETIQLKKSKNLMFDFLSLRRAHQKRHDFCSYELEENRKQILELLGCD